MHIARAYGVNTTSASRPSPVTPAHATRPTSAATQQPGASRLLDLVAGKLAASSDASIPPSVTDGLDAITPRGAGQPYALYTRAADKVEAAVALLLGASVDVKG